MKKIIHKNQVVITTLAVLIAIAGYVSYDRKSGGAEETKTVANMKEDAKLMFENGRYKNALNIAYYSIFHAIRSVNTLKGFDSSKHSGVIAFFNQSYVKEGVFDKELSKIIKQAYDYREKADYLDFYIASSEEAGKQIARAEVFKEAIKTYLVEQDIL